MERSFQAYWEPMEAVTLFKYMGRVLALGYDYWKAVAANLRKARKICMWMTRILIREGEDTKVSGLFFKVVVEAVLILGA